MANTMTLIASTTVGAGGASSATFSSIPSTYTDLVVRFSGRTNTAGVRMNINLQLNGSNSGYNNKVLSGDGSSTSSGSNYTGTTQIYLNEINGGTSTSNTFSNVDIYIPNYTGSNYKSVSADSVYENNGTTAFAVLTAGVWSNTAAITQINLSPGADSFVQYSTFYLYGIKNS
jgi:hypothetical protein